jgi:3D (Asp-Asp-Asp) domain-containing protein
MGMGSHLNALVPLRHAAVDQRRIPYGSLIHVAGAAGTTLGESPSMDGWFWAADTGGAVTGNHCDLFVGESEIYLDFLHKPNRRERYETHIYPLPKAPAGYDPRHDHGLEAILRAKGFLNQDTLADKTTLRDALVTFQKTISWIPPAEHGDPDAATTLWFLIHAALEAAPQKDSSPTPPGPPEKTPTKPAPSNP